MSDVGYRLATKTDPLDAQGLSRRDIDLKSYLFLLLLFSVVLTAGLIWSGLLHYFKIPNARLQAVHLQADAQSPPPDHCTATVGSELQRNTRGDLGECGRRVV